MKTFLGHIFGLVVFTAVIGSLVGLGALIDAAPPLVGSIVGFSLLGFFIAGMTVVVREVGKRKARS